MQTTHPVRVISQVVLPRTAAVTLGLMVGFAFLTFLLAQIRIYLPGNPVPITGQTFAVLLAGASLGTWAGAGSQLIYVLVGMLGVPVFADFNGGWEYATGATFGYLIGFIVAAWIVGFLAERGQDRKVWSAVPAFLAGNAVIYVFGVTWLWLRIDAFETIYQAAETGMLPFIIGDLLKIALAGILLPVAWKLVDRAGLRS